MCFSWRTGVIAAAVLMPLACSVKEDRSQCPCYVCVDLTQLDAGRMVSEGCDSLVWSLSGEGFRKSGALRLDALPGSIEIEAPREMVRLRVIASASGFCGLWDTLKVAKGQEVPPLMFYSGSVDAVPSEGAEVVLGLHKRYVTLDLGCDLRDPFFEGVEMAVEGCFAGYSRSAGPLAGAFRCILAPDPRGRSTVRLPPQADGSLRLSLYRDGSLERSFALGEYILKSGYDWSKEDLEDIRMDLELHRSYARLKIDQWERILVFNIVI